MCPLCHRSVRVYEGSVSCTGEDCGWHISRKIGGKSLTDKHLASLLKGKPTDIIKGLTNREGTKTFDARVRLDEEGRLTYVFENPFDKLVCPQCGKSGVRVFDKFIACSNREGCGWSISRTIAGHTLTQAQVIRLLSAGRTEAMEFPRKFGGTLFKAGVVLRENEDKRIETGFEFVRDNKKDEK